MKVKEVLGALERFAPLPLQDGFDNAGLQIGLTEAEATGALLCLDVTEEVVDEAVALGVNLIVAHHPLLFAGCKSITGKDEVERCVLKAIKHDVAVYAAHTNLDNAQGGVNFRMARQLSLQDVRVLRPLEGKLLKLVTFVPTDHAEALRAALFQAGCGNIGAYDCCSYNIQGVGTFRPGEHTNPYCGVPGSLHEEAETRIETILPAYLRRRVLAALLKAHPYEEPAYDFYTLAQDWPQVGSGIIGTLPKAMPESEFLQQVKQKFQVACLRHNGPVGRSIERVALCGGSGAFLIPDAIAAGADAFLTGEIGYHKFFGRKQEILLMEAGHYETEQYTKELLQEILERSCPDLKIYLTRINTNPIKYL